MKVEDKNKAILLRKSGESINSIAKKLNVSKSSASIWVRGIKLTTAQRKKLSKNGFSIDVIEKRRISRLKNTQLRKEVVMKTAEQDIEHVSHHELKLIGCMLYWAEGRKRGQQTIGFSNSDPEMIKMMMRFFREVCKVPEKKFRGHIHIHSHLQVKKAEKYWSGVSKIPLKQFYKTYSKPSIAGKGKTDSLPNGTFDICVHDVNLFLKIMGWIRKTAKLVNYK